MKYESCKDYFICGNTIKLSGSGQDKRRKFKITGTKVPWFFEGISKEYEKDSYNLGSRVFNFPEVKPISQEERRNKEKNFQFENNIRKHLEKNLNVSFSGYPIGTADIYRWDETFGGVPDGEEFRGNEVVSVLEIKRRRPSDKNSETFLSSYILQLSLYLCLRNLDSGYICVFMPSNQQEWNNPQDVVFKSPLVRKHIRSPKQSINLNSEHLKISDKDYAYEILEKGDNGSRLTIYKVKIDAQKYRLIMTNMKNGYEKYSKTGPKMNERQIKDLLFNNKK